MRRSEATSGTLLLVALAFPKTIAILTTFVIGEKWLMADQDAVPKRDEAVEKTLSKKPALFATTVTSAVDRTPSL
jgi:hypothetical protein